ncbi:G-type lectin S-receptor-like serine/threonine-protein kinase LECRK3 [Rosa chinensis]|nr:G-type lectin S-receptor-like serine/threonine-protein kinase LECRK3 [Rosa chinensis]
MASILLPYPFYLLLLLLLLLLLQLLPISAVAQTYKNISLGSSLTALDNNSFWASPSGEFAFGFQEVSSNGFLLAIWFNKIAERTIVWSANANNLLQKGSKVVLNADGQLLLNDAATSKQLLLADSVGREVAYAAMLDTGNFVLANQNSMYLWESFTRPTNTLLPTQTLNQGTILFAPTTATNYSKGRFMFTLQDDGNLLLYTTHYPSDTANFPYWSTQSMEIGYQVIFNQTGAIYLTSKNGSILTAVLNNTASTMEFYHRVTLDYDGVLRYYVYPKSTGTSGHWITAWSTLSIIPPNICVSISQDKGGGACGFNGLCQHDQGPSCQCPVGYSFIDPNDELRGCKQNFVQQSCDGTSPETDLFYFEEMQNTAWPQSDYEKFTPVTEDWCRQTCLADCFCAVANFRNGDCWIKSIPLRNGRIDPSNGAKALIKIRRGNSTLKPEHAHSRRKNRSTLILVGSVLLSSSGFLNFLLVLITYMVVSGFYFKKGKVVQPYSVIPGMNLICFTYEELNKATNEFKEELGRGAFATVFRGDLESDNGRSVAVKRLNTTVKESELEFKAELSAIGRTNHRNLVQLIGFCNEGEHRILVYEFMSNGSLASFLFGESRPSWHQRRQIALGTARGLLYLHEECSSQIIHCDIKPQNVLLDDSFTARISDFGLAKLLKTDQTRTTTGIRGTKGYVAPEWFKNMPITTKVDVYSYGILLLEIICLRKYFEAEAEDEDQMILADWAYDCYVEKKLHLLFDNDDEAVHDIKNLEKYLMIAFWCIQEDPSLRPTTKKLTLMLEGTVDVSIPPDPSSFASSIL